MNVPRFLEIKHLAAEDLQQAVELDRLCFGGFWSIEGYRRELESPNSDLLGLWIGETEEGSSERISFDIFTPQHSELSAATPNGTDTGAAPLQISRKFIGLGCLWAVLEEAHIIMLAIHPQFQSRGFGQALLWALLKSACDRQLERATLEVRASNLAAVSLYKKFDFKEAGLRKKYYEDTGEDALVMWRSGLEKPEFQEYLESKRQEICDRLRRKKW
ncbi:MAG: ribosomal protein S18-alanine N-acetyltransferase [Richelia sp. CSU_2_1]|nr:ribosomal protein S18-alanine N-acetyltransferase [Richelia sp. CSU_2_1]